jgi:hypothetical protein
VSRAVELGGSVACSHRAARHSANSECQAKVR